MKKLICFIFGHRLKTTRMICGSRDLRNDEREIGEIKYCKRCGFIETVWG